MNTPVISDLALDLGTFALDNESENGRHGRRHRLIPASAMIASVLPQSIAVNMYRPKLQA